MSLQHHNVSVRSASWAFQAWPPGYLRAAIWIHVPMDLEPIGGRVTYRPPMLWSTTDEIRELFDTPAYRPWSHVVARGWERILVRLWAGWRAEPWHIACGVGLDLYPPAFSRLRHLALLGEVNRWRGPVTLEEGARRA